tara:strand:+ start:655 stop:1182 length:528 start_codon:yes stop_codon:yes gene_type:complete
MNSLIIYSTTDGQTKKICEEIKNNSIYKQTYKIISIDEALEINISNYDQIILGASIRYGKHDSKIYKFIKNNKNILDEKKNAFFSVNVVARKPEKNSFDTNPYIKKFLKKSSWKPKKLAVFAGKVDYPNLNLINRNIIRLIMFITNGPTNTKNVYEFTDWQKVKKFSKEFDNMKI